MSVLLQIDTCLGILSTGRITESIAKLARSKGWQTYIAHGARYVGHSEQVSYQVVNKLGEYLHYGYSLLLDKHGLASALATRKLIRLIKQISPDIIHLHCIHGYYLNYQVLFNFLNKSGIQVVWTFHDCWAFTGHCAYFDSVDCEKWKTGCNKCPLKGDYPKAFVDKSRNNFLLKKKLFLNCPNLTIITVSDWLHQLTSESFWGENNIITIHNGTDVNVFKPSSQPYNNVKIQNKKIVLGVAAIWDKRKGLEDFIYLSKIINKDTIIVLVGLDSKLIELLPSNIVGITRTNDAKELAALYSNATVFVNPTYSDNFPTTNIEALACGTPIVTYKTGGSPEAIDIKTGIVVEKGNQEALAVSIDYYLKLPSEELNRVRNACRERALRLFNKDDRFNEYLLLYENLIKK